jgi:hypothetical protein
MKMKFTAAPLLIAAHILVGPAFAETTPADVIGTWKTDVGEQPAPDGSTSYLLVTTSFTEDTQDLGSRLIDRQSQNMTVAARAMADRKVWRICHSVLRPCASLAADRT